MENTAIVKDILNRKKKDRLVAVLLYIIAFLVTTVVYLYHQNVRVNQEKQDIITQTQEQRIDDLKKENEYLLYLKNQVDSANNKLQIFNIEKQMK